MHKKELTNKLYLVSLIALYVWSSVVLIVPFEPIKPTGLEVFFGTLIGGGLLSFHILLSSSLEIKLNSSKLLKTNIIMSGLFLSVVILFCTYIFIWKM